jgi:site-specific recombinase XerD
VVAINLADIDWGRRNHSDQGQRQQGEIGSLGATSPDCLATYLDKSRSLFIQAGKPVPEAVFLNRFGGRLRREKYKKILLINTLMKLPSPRK